MFLPLVDTYESAVPPTLRNKDWLHESITRDVSICQGHVSICQGHVSICMRLGTVGTKVAQSINEVKNG